jgi:hypothetical protein
MRVLATVGYTLAGLMLAAPAARAQQPVYYAPVPAGMAPAGMAPAPAPYYAPVPAGMAPAGMAPAGMAPAPAPTQAPHKHKRSLFGGEKLCPDCQRARVKAQDGVNVPPPPPLPGVVSSGGSCTACGGHTHMVLNGDPRSMMTAGGEASGYAVVGNDPTPIGEVQPMLAGSRPTPGARGGGPRDASVMMSGYSPTPVKPDGVNRPHVISHLLGVSAIGRQSREARARRKEERHASIAYGPQQTPPVNDLPARMVYGYFGR